MEEDLRLVSLYSRSLLEASLDPLVTISPDGKITDVNKATEEVTRLYPRAAYRERFLRLFHRPGAGEGRVSEGDRRGSCQGLSTYRSPCVGRTTDVLYNASV